MILKGVTIVPGTCYGKIHNILSIKQETGSSFLGVAKSIEKYDEVISITTKELNELVVKNQTEEKFIDAHAMILSDPVLRKEVVAVITNEKIGPEDAFIKVINTYIDKLKSSTNTYLRERYLDFEDIKSRVCYNFRNNKISLKNVHDSIIVCDEIYPSMLVDMSPSILGFIARKGGYTSHSAIICRSLNIPFVVCEEITDELAGTAIISDSDIIINPKIDVVSEYIKKIANPTPIVKNLHGLKVYANVRSNEDIKGLTDEFSGVGLYRTEFILTSRSIAYSVSAQQKIYEEALELANGKPIIFRTFDCGDDKKIDFFPKACKSVANYFIYEEAFDVQIEALLRASIKYPNIYVMFPMIESFMQYKELKKRIVKKCHELDCKLPKIGITLETEKALSNLYDFRNVDFISIGTNDLTKELFNVDRDAVVLFDSLLDDLALACKKVIDFCREKSIKLSICGELGCNPEFLKKVTGYGLKNISISPSMINTIYKTLN